MIITLTSVTKKDSWDPGVDIVRLLQMVYLTDV